MNILHTETLYNWGGEQNKVLREMMMERELGHNVMLFANPNSIIGQRAQEMGFKVIYCVMNKKDYLKSIPMLYKTIKENNIVFVFSHGSTDSWNVAICRSIFRILGNKKIQFMRERHNLYPIKGFASKFMHKKMFDKILYLSESVRDYLKEIGLKDSQLFYTPTVVDTKNLCAIKSAFREEFEIPQDALVIGTFTSLYRKKGVYDFANAAKEALKTYSDAYIVFAGKIKENVKSEILNLFKKKDKVIFTDFREDSVNIIKSFDIYVFASHSEGLGTVLLEAMCSKTPIVVYDIAPMNLLVKNKERGLCAKYLDDKDLAKKILEMLEDKESAQMYAKNALDFVCENYDLVRLKEALKELLKEGN